MTAKPFTLFVANRQQAILYECELKGQISDGYWENSVPHNHWRVPCRADAVVATGDQKVGANFPILRKGYNFAAKLLLDCVGNRMIGYVKMYTVFPNLSYNNNHDYSFELTAQELVTETERGLKDTQSKYWNEKAHRVMKAFDVKTIEELRKLLAIVDAVPYGMKELKKDLKALSVAIRTRV